MSLTAKIGHQQGRSNRIQFNYRVIDTSLALERVEHEKAGGGKI